MKKIFVGILCIMLILSLCACGANTREDTSILSSSSGDQAELPDEEPSDVIKGTNYKGGYKVYSDARSEFVDYVVELYTNDTSLLNNQTLVLNPEIEAFDYLTPILYWGETLEDNELAVKDISLSVITGEDKRFRSADLERISDNSYTMTIETSKGEKIDIQVDYYPDIDAVHLEAENNGEHALLFEYVKTTDGYADQFYFNSVVASGYGEQNKEMCVYRSIFSGKDGSCARFDGVERPDSILDGVTDAETFIEGATHWFTLKDGKFTNN